MTWGRLALVLVVAAPALAACGSRPGAGGGDASAGTGAEAAAGAGLDAKGEGGGPPAGDASPDEAHADAVIDGDGPVGDAAADSARAPDPGDVPAPRPLHVTVMPAQYVHTVLGNSAGFDNRTVTPVGKLIVELGVDSGGYQTYLGKRGFHVLGVKQYHCIHIGVFDPPYGQDYEGNCRLTALDGVPRGGPENDANDQVTATDNVIARIATGLAMLQAAFPEEDWGFFLNADGTVRWSDVGFTGIGYAAGNALIYAHQLRVFRAVARSGAYENRCGSPGPPVPKIDPLAPGYDPQCPADRFPGWYDSPSATPLDRYFGFAGNQDGSFWSILFGWERMGLVGAPINLSLTKPPFSGTHRFYANLGRSGFETLTDAMDIAWGPLAEVPQVTACADGTTASCAAALGAVGSCATGVATCEKGRWGACSISPAKTDSCNIDNDDSCDGRLATGCACINGFSASCGVATGARGTCAAGTTVCKAGQWDACSIAPTPADRCAFENDDSCDGLPTSGCAEICDGFTLPSFIAPDGAPNRASYDLSAPGVTLDRITGLAWQQAVSQTSDRALTEPEAAAHCAASRLAGFADWRLPTALELLSLTDDSAQWAETGLDKPAVDVSAFPATPIDTYWTSTPGPGAKRKGYGAWWFVDATHGEAIATTAGANLVRCVRSTGTPAATCYPPDGRYVQFAGVVLDQATGLRWRQAAEEGLTLQAAASTCAGLAGMRLPTLKELETIVDHEAAPGMPAIDARAFPGTPRKPFWTATASAALSIGATVDFGDSGAVAFGADGFANLFAVRCVH